MLTRESGIQDVLQTPPPLAVRPQVAARVLGRGRSGMVYLRDGDLACKVFDSNGLTRLVQCVLLGSPNPYVWSEDAVRCAVLRRRILAGLVEYWCGDGVRVASAVGYCFNEAHRAFELRTEFTPGRPIPLRQSAHAPDLLDRLTKTVMAPLQRLLIDSGLAGLAWQAGLGNPVALNNFLYEEAGDRFVWIDLESGVPALFPANPLRLLTFYLPLAFRFGRPVFDDVDTKRLVGYLGEHAGPMRRALGPERTDELAVMAAELDAHQAAWKSIPWHWRSIENQRVAGELTDARATHYRRHRGRFFAHEVGRMTRSGLRRLLRLPGKVAATVGRVPWLRLPSLARRSLFSQRFRDAMTRMYVAHRIRRWRRRGQLSAGEAKSLRARLRSNGVAAYLGDFGVHLAIKPFVKVAEWWVLPLLWSCGVIGTGTLAAGMLGLGCLVRTIYTTYRVAQASVAGHERPWLALGLGVFPVLGNLAFPAQLLRSTRRQDEADAALAQFIVHDGAARLGRHIPIFGGEDTWTEHWFHRLPNPLTRRS